MFEKNDYINMKTINCIGKSVLLISDQHAPYHHKDTIKFLKAIKKKYRPDIVINLGDELDYHSISFHSSDQELFSASHELEQGLNYIEQLERLWPIQYICSSNHGSLMFRRAKSEGIPITLLKTYQEIYNTPAWEWHEDYILKTKLGPVYVCHGKTGTYGKMCKEAGMSAVQGHFHGKFEITWHHSETFQRFNMFAGCLIDRDSLAFAYGKNHIPKPILGLGMISKHGYPRMIKMNLNSKGRWDGNLPDF